MQHFAVYQAAVGTRLPPAAFDPLTYVKRVSSVSEQQGKQDSQEIEEVSGQLRRSLKLCHSLIDDYRSKLAVNPKIDNLNVANDDEQATAG